MSKRIPGCSGCGSTEHNARSCDSEAGARWYEAQGRHAEAAKVRRRAALIAQRPEDVPLDELLIELAFARRDA